MRLRQVLLVLLIGFLGFGLGYVLRGPSPPDATPAPSVVRPGPEIRIEPDGVELLPGQHLTIDAGPPPDVSSAAPP